jgi:hypothetical protein
MYFESLAAAWHMDGHGRLCLDGLRSDDDGGSVDGLVATGTLSSALAMGQRGPAAASR